MSPAPGYRCTACGNLTRFDVVTDRRVKAFHHYSVGGELAVEDVEVLSSRVIEIELPVVRARPRHRGCSTGDARAPPPTAPAAERGHGG